MTSTIKVDTIQTAAGGTPTAADLGLNVSGSVLQVVSATKSDIWSSSATTGQEIDITGLSATITPTSASSKILVATTVHGSRSGDYAIFAFSTYRNGTLIGAGDASGSGSRVTAVNFVFGASDVNNIANPSNTFLDAPATTSALTYQIKAVNVSGATRTLYVNYAANQAADAGGVRPISTITLMEIAQ